MTGDGQSPAQVVSRVLSHATVIKQQTDPPLGPYSPLGSPALAAGRGKSSTILECAAVESSRESSQVKSSQVVTSRDVLAHVLASDACSDGLHGYVMNCLLHAASSDTR